MQINILRTNQSISLIAAKIVIQKSAIKSPANPTSIITNFSKHFTFSHFPNQNFKAMASFLQASFLFFFLFVSSLALEAAAAREVPTDAKMSFDGTVWVPGLGRFMLPKKGSKSLDYNPITGEPGGNGVSIPGLGGSTGSNNYIPGGDDTFVPTPGTEVPNPSSGGVLAPSSP